jgi:hypothetical protein
LGFKPQGENLLVTVNKYKSGLTLTKDNP